LRAGRLPLLKLLHGRFFDKALDPSIFSGLHDTESGGIFSRNRDRSDRQLGITLLVEFKHLPVVHLVELVSREDQDILILMIPQMVQGLADGISRPLVPLLTSRRLFSSQNIYKPLAEDVKIVGVLDVTVQRS